MTDTMLTRRRAIAAGCGVCVAAAAAACGSDPAPAPQAPATGGTQGASGKAELTKVADIPDGGSLVVDNVLLARSGDTVVGHSAICTHQGGKLNADGAKATCPLHGSAFDATTGAVINSPATAPLPAVPVTVEGGAVFQA